MGWDWGEVWDRDGWYGEVWSGLDWPGLVWCGLAWCDVVWSSMVSVGLGLGWAALRQTRAARREWRIGQTIPSDCYSGFHSIVGWSLASALVPEMEWEWGG